MTKTRKIPMKKREIPKQRCTTFSKRRFGLFSKAAELCILFDAQVAILVKSMNRKHGDIYSFGHPSTDDVFRAFLNNEAPPPLDKQAKESAIALHDKCKALRIGKNEEEEEEEVEENEEEGSNKFWLQLESMDLDSIQSVEVLNGIIEKIKSLKENISNKLKYLKNQINDNNEYLVNKAGGDIDYLKKNVEDDNEYLKTKIDEDNECLRKIIEDEEFMDFLNNIVIEI